MTRRREGGNVVKKDSGHSIGDAFIVLIGMLFGTELGLITLVLIFVMVGGGITYVVQHDIPNPITIEQLSTTTVSGGDGRCYRIVQQIGVPLFVPSDCPK